MRLSGRLWIWNETDKFIFVLRGFTFQRYAFWLEQTHVAGVSKSLKYFMEFDLDTSQVESGGPQLVAEIKAIIVWGCCNISSWFTWWKSLNDHDLFLVLSFKYFKYFVARRWTKYLGPWAHLLIRLIYNHCLVLLFKCTVISNVTCFW